MFGCWNFELWWIQYTNFLDQASLVLVEDWTRSKDL